MRCWLQWCLSLCILKAFADGSDSFDLAYRYFRSTNVNNVLLYDCSPNDAFQNFKKLSSHGFQVSRLEVSNTDILEQQLIARTRIGVWMDFGCQQSADVLETASRTKSFHDGRPWLISLPHPVSSEDLRNFFDLRKPGMFNITEYFLMEYERTRLRRRMDEINAEINAKLLQEIYDEENISYGTDYQNITHLDWLAPLSAIGAFVNSHVLLSAPGSTGDGQDLYIIHRKTNHTAMEVEPIEESLQELESPSAMRRQDFHRTIMRAGCGLFYSGFFNRSDVLAPPALQVDLWSTMTFFLYKLLEEQLNFRMLVKCFDDYGWPVNGQFTGLVGFMQRGHAEISATGVIMHNERMNVADYVEGLFEFKLGILLRQPSLGSVANIFVLPFSSSVWAALLALLFTTSVIVWTQLKANQWVTADSDHRSATIGDVMYFITGVVCQRGDHLLVQTIAVRLSMLVVLVFSLFLFTSYSASIVSLLQSPAHFINDLDDLLDSDMAIGIENLPYEKKFLKEDDHEVVQKIYEQKIVPQQERGFLNTTDGIKHVRNGMFAFQCELPNAYKLIGETYTASEKCGLTKLDMFPNRILGSLATKKSPYKEVLNIKLKWLREVGLTNRVMRRWSHSKPACTSAMGGYDSLTITHVRHLLYFFTYGLGVALIAFIVEVVLHFWDLKVKGCRKVSMKKGERKKAWVRSSPFEFVM